MDYVYFHLFLFVLLTTYTIDIQGYDFQCPTNTHWNLRSRIQCNDTIDRYTCLFKYSNIGITFEETCNGPELNREGFKRVMRPVYFDNEPCPSSHFQPLRFTSVGNTECFFKKSLCSEEGQIEYSPGSTTTDRFCRCDYTKGYAFVTKPNDPCLCDPHNEDCSCYRKPCKDSVLSADYECITIYTLEYPTSCPSIQTFRPQEIDVISRLDKTLDQDAEDHFLIKLIRLKEKETFIPSVIATLVLGMIILLLVTFLVGVWYMTEEDIISVRLENAVCIKNQPVMFMCKLRRLVLQQDITWTKDDIIIEEGDNIKIKHQGKMHILQIVSTSSDMEGKYKFSVKGCAFDATSEARLIVIEATMNGAKYLSILQVIQTKATKVVRSLFDKIFPPDKIKDGRAFEQSQLDELKRKKIITKSEMKQILPGDVEGHTPSSNDFEIRLMIKLIRNFTSNNIRDELPEDDEVGISAELSRLKLYKNELVNMDPGALEDQSYTDLSEMLNKVETAVGRLEQKFEAGFKLDDLINFKSKQTDNYIRMIGILLDVGTEVFRELLKKRFPPDSFYGSIIEPKRRLLYRLIHSTDRDILFPSASMYSGDLSDINISTLYVLLRNIGNIKAHNNGWGKDPDETDRSPSANIERISTVWRTIEQFSSASLPDEQFNKLWESLRTSIKELEGETYAGRIDAMLHKPITERERRSYYLNFLEKTKQAVKTKDTESSIPSEETNFLRFYLLCQTITTDAVRVCFDRHVPPDDLYRHLRIHENNLRGKWKCYNEQLKVLFPANKEPRSKDFDYPLLYKLIRNTLTVPAPAQGWGKEPHPTNIGETDDVERARKFRNLLAHTERCKLTDYLFQTYWTELSMAIHRLSDGSLTAEVDKLKQKEQGQGKLKEMQQSLIQARKEIKDFQQEIRDLRRQTETIRNVGGKVTVGTQT